MPQPEKPLIGITCHFAEQPDGRGNINRYLRVTAQYARAIRDAGGLPVILPALDPYAAPAEEIPGRLDGLLLSGGTDLPPTAFHDVPNPTLREIDPGRYDYETGLVRAARAQGMPLMGICRGHQTIIEALGGRLILNLEKNGYPGHYQELAHEKTSHGLTTRPGTPLADRLGERISVNSFHRQAAAAPPEGFVAAAFAEDGLIEAVWSADPFALGIQFHPEWLYGGQEGFLGLFREFVTQAGGFAAGRRNQG